LSDRWRAEVGRQLDGSLNRINGEGVDRHDTIQTELGTCRDVTEGSQAIAKAKPKDALRCDFNVAAVSLKGIGCNIAVFTGNSYNKASRDRDIAAIPISLRFSRQW
jgi:hypothetical protein